MTALFLGLLMLVSPVSQATAGKTAESCECEVIRPLNLAVVNGTPIRTSQIEADTGHIVAQVREELDGVREKALQNVIAARLLEVEAAKRNTTVPQLLQVEVVAKADEPTEDELRAFYERNRAGMTEPFERVRDGLRQYVRGQRQQVQMTILTTDLRTAAKIETLEYSPKGPAANADLARVVAIVNGSKVTLGDVEETIRNQTYQVRMQIYEIEKTALDGRIDEILIGQEAQRRNVAVDALVAQEVAPRIRKVDAFDAAKFYNENKDRFGGRSLQDVREELLRVLQLKAEVEARAAFAATLRPAAKIEIALVEPAPPTWAIDIAGRPSIGGAGAAVTVVVFSDFECAKCAATHQIFEDVVRSYGPRVKFVARHFPLEQHENAYRAAQAAEAAFQQGKYWEFSKLLYENHENLTDARLRELATQAGLDRARFDAALDSGQMMALVDRDVSDGARIGVVGTPSVYVNGRAVAEDTAEGLRAAIDKALKAGG
ncbi:MAG: thioredoxin domain-containing protein [Acidobacteria bacterium]|nr:thioredoxin domain-containing protein [Acidobacteriota bacterium]